MIFTVEAMLSALLQCWGLKELTNALFDVSNIFTPYLLNLGIKLQTPLKGGAHRLQTPTTSRACTVKTRRARRKPRFSDKKAAKRRLLLGNLV